MTMIERVARAMWETFRSFKDDTCYGNYRTEPHWEELNQFTKDGYMLMARAAIEAMREMTPEMLEAMKLNTWAYIEGKWDDDMRAEVEDHEKGWRAAIDAALKEGEK